MKSGHRLDQDFLSLAVKLGREDAAPRPTQAKRLPNERARPGWGAPH
jgi:hypothetical protein